MLIENVYDTGVGGAKWLFGAAHVFMCTPHIGGPFTE